MKKLFTLIALMACFLGVKAVEKVDAEVDFSKYTDISEWNFPNSWGGSESARARLSIKDGCLHFESTEATDPTWDCQFFPIGGVNAEIETVYTLHFKIKGDHAGNVSMLGFGQTPYGAFPITTEWVEGTVEYVAASADGNILMQCGDWIGSWDIAYLKITHEERADQRPKEWIELLENGDAETPWADPNIRFNDQENNYKICAWGKEKGVNMNENGGWDPFPATIEDDGTGNHVFVVHGKAADTEGDPSAWDNQFWIEAPRQLKPGELLKIHFRYKASEAATTNTQIHHQNPSDYQFYQCLGDINFTTEWQEFDKEVSWPGGGDIENAWSIAFNLNPQNKNAIDFYFDDLSIAELKLDHGFFVASSNAAAGIEYDFDNAIEFEDGGDGTLIATVGEAGKPDTWVNEIMISTVRGHDGSFKAATIKPSGAIQSGDDYWNDYTEGSNAKIKLPAAGVWQITLDTEFKSINFVQIEGDTPQGPVEINPNPTEVVVKAPERDDTASERPADEAAGITAGTGQPWDSQFWIVANRTLDAGEVTVLSFKYKSSIPAKTSTQCHEMPGNYIHWAAIGDVNFTEDWQEFSATFTIPNECNGSQNNGYLNTFKSIAFNMAEIKDANEYHIKDVVWKTEDGTESLIDQTGKQNFYVKEGSGDTPHVFDDGTGIKGVYTNGNSQVSGATYNLAGQRVSKEYKGIVVKNGSKYIVK